MPHPNAVNPKTGLRYGFEEEQRRKKAESPEAIHKQIALLKRQKAALEARERFLPFIKFTMPDPEDPNDVERSAYKDAKHHRASARVLEEVEKGEIRFLIFTMPPRHGKSEQVSRRFPAWFIGRHPAQNVVVATYNDDFANDFGKDVRNIMQTPQYRQVFPDVKLQRGGAASDRLQTTKGGLMSFVGRGGSLTGRGAHCFPAGTMVETRYGAVPIERLVENDEVLSYDEKQRTTVWRCVQAVASRPRSGLYRITTAAGRVVEATSDHRFYANGRWVEARELAPGDRLVCAVRRDVDAEFGGHGEARTPRAPEPLLLCEVLGRGGEHSQVRGAGLQLLQRPGTESDGRGDASKGSRVLFGAVHGTGAERGIRSVGAGAHETVRSLQCAVPSGEQRDAVLRAGLLVSGTCGADEEGRKPALERRCFGQPSEAACGTDISGDAASGHAAGRRKVRAVRGISGAGCPSHRREPDEQSGHQSRNAVPSVSHEGALFGASVDFVSRVDADCGDADVYDIQVEETECFFANGVLAHNCLICDDLIKDDKEAQSQAIRDQAWNWFTKVAMSRRMGMKLVILTFTRWHSDDPIGRLTDPENPHYNEALARKIKIINFPAIAEEDDPLGRAPGDALWPELYDLDFLEEQRGLDPLGFAALYQQRPSLLDGDLFKRENIRFYDRLPDTLRYYAASDHAVGTGQRNDPSCFIKIGIDERDDIYITDVVWKKMPTDQAVEAMLAMGRGNSAPLRWWAERGHISKSIGPFLRKRMLETGTYLNIAEVTPVADKAQRAQSIAARVAMGKVYFPRTAPWAEKAINEMMAFPNGTHDDFCDALAYIGLGLQSQFRPGKNVAQERRDAQPKFGTLAWVKMADKQAAEARERQAAGGF